MSQFYFNVFGSPKSDKCLKLQLGVALPGLHFGVDVLAFDPLWVQSLRAVLNPFASEIPERTGEIELKIVERGIQQVF